MNAYLLLPTAASCYGRSHVGCVLQWRGGRQESASALFYLWHFCLCKIAQWMTGGRKISDFASFVQLPVPCGIESMDAHQHFLFTGLNSCSGYRKVEKDMLLFCLLNPTIWIQLPPFHCLCGRVLGSTLRLYMEKETAPGGGFLHPSTVQKWSVLTEVALASNHPLSSQAQSTHLSCDQRRLRLVICAGLGRNSFAPCKWLTKWNVFCIPCTVGKGNWMWWLS